MRERTEQALARLNRELESQVRARTAELEAAVKELDAFAFSVSHDLRAPVRHVNGYLSLLKEELGEALAGQPAHYIDSALDATRHMNRLIDDLLAFSRSARAPLAVQRVELDAAVRDALAELEPETAGREIEFKIEALPPVWADPALLRVVLMNLLSNAVKYTAHRRPARIAIEAGAGGATEVVIGVHDNGVGFDMRHADKLFGVFQRLHSNEEYEGTGVGLATVQRILHRHGGRIWAEAEPDRGATFRFTLHRADA